jgi:hypothetical protein
MIIYDLDHTLVDSSHRAITRADGSLCLDSWHAMSTREHIMCDSLLPLAYAARDQIAEARDVAICTARVLAPADYEFLRVHGLRPRVILSRPYGDNSADGPLKVRLLREASIHPRIFWDDNESVRRAIKRAFPYCSVICPHGYNARMAA